MSPGDVLDISKDALIVIIKMGAPMLLVALTVGIIISFLQALTQIQEMTLSFVPKILATFAVLLFTMPFVANTLKVFTEQIFDKMIGLN